MALRTGIRSAVLGGALLLQGAVAAASGPCFRGRPLPECQSFWVTETGISFRLGGDSGSATAVTFDAGHLWNLGSRSALGGTIFFRIVDPTESGTEDAEIVDGAGLRPRVRFWIDHNWSLDVAPGIVVVQSGVDPDPLLPTLNAQMALGWKNYAALTAEADLLRPSGAESRLDWYVGGRLGNEAGLVGTLGFFALVGLVALTW